MAATPLVGRSREAGEITALLDGLPERGGAVVVRGEPGIGKSALLARAGMVAAERGSLVMSAAGVQSEAKLPFAGLHRLLRPVLAQADRLAPLQRNALMSAFGMIDGPAPDLYLIAMAALELLSDAAGRAPILLIVEDAHWLDRPSSDALAFVGRRLELDPIILLAAIRDGYEDSPMDSGLPELRLDRLADGPAAELLGAHFPNLAPAVRERVLEEAAGNPLALLELPVALGPRGREGEVVLPINLPLTTRLEQAFASRAAELPAPTRAVLQIAAVDDGEALAEVLSAAEIVGGVKQTVEVLVPAIEAKLVNVEGHAIRFRHPLVRSAVHQAASVAERHAAHAALAEVLSHDPDRGVWHRAAAALGTDPEVAVELEQAGGRAQKRGAGVLAVAAFERAAALTEEPARRGALLLRAAASANELGRSELVMRLLREADSLDLAPHDRARWTWLLATYNRQGAGDPARIHILVETAARMFAESDTDLALELLSLAAFRCFWSDPGDEARREVLLAADRIGSGSSDPRLILIAAYAAPVERGSVVIDRLADVAGNTDPEAFYFLGMAAHVVGVFDRSETLLARSIARLREQGRLGLLAQVLIARAWAATQRGHLGVARTAAAEGARLAGETGQPVFRAGAQAVAAMVAALHGEQTVVEELTSEAERFAVPVSATAVLTLVQSARGWLALGQGRHAEAYDQLRRLFDPGDSAYHHILRCWALGDLAEAAGHSDRREEARSVLHELEATARQTPSPWLHVGILYARPLLAAEADAEPLFRAALGTDMTRWPHYRARLELAFGEWLRRRRRTADARAPLRAARDAFDALGFGPWGERARQELRASGESSRRRTPDMLDELTAQELQIVQMAAAGLSNREIGQRLFLSRRTVESHLYRVFPKLGVTSRAQLPRVLATETDESSSAGGTTDFQ